MPALYHNAVAGYPSCFVYSMVLLGLVVLWRAGEERSPRIIFWMIVAGMLAGLLAAPSLLPSLWALGDSVRAEGMEMSVAAESSMPVAVQVGSMLIGGLAFWCGDFSYFGKVWHGYALASFAAGWWVLMAFVRGRAAWRAWDFFLLGGVILFMLLVSRPEWLAALVAELPLLRSLRWPVKELYLVVFLWHLWAARGSALGLKVVRLGGCAGVCVFVISLLAAGAPTLNEQKASRESLLSGEAELHWSKLREQVPEGQYLVGVLPDAVVQDVTQLLNENMVMSGGGNFFEMFEVPGWTGYSLTLPRSLSERRPAPATATGLFRESQARELEAVGGLILLRRGGENAEGSAGRDLR
ncbi:MAG: hypothetical protein HC904_10075 [Blastochloris sp.]|nr:hypothetical protein [Blastochloris sp.]